MEPKQEVMLTQHSPPGYNFDIPSPTSLRDPIDLFTSLWDYAKLGEVYGMPLKRYALSEKSGRLADRKRIMLRHMGRNQMLFDFGLDPRHFDDEEMVKRKIEEIDKGPSSSIHT